MATNTIETFYLGVFSDFDTNESNFSTEFVSALNGYTAGSTSAPLHDDISSLTLDDADNSGDVSENDTGQSTENLICDGVASGLDSTFEYNVTLTYSDGSTATTKMVLMQDMAGQ